MDAGRAQAPRHRSRASHLPFCHRSQAQGVAQKHAWARTNPGTEAAAAPAAGGGRAGAGGSSARPPRNQPGGLPRRRDRHGRRPRAPWPGPSPPRRFRCRATPRPQRPGAPTSERQPSTRQRDDAATSPTTSISSWSMPTRCCRCASTSGPRSSADDATSVSGCGSRIPSPMPWRPPSTRWTRSGRRVCSASTPSPSVSPVPVRRVPLPVAPREPDDPAPTRSCVVASNGRGRLRLPLRLQLPELLRAQEPAGGDRGVPPGLRRRHRQAAAAQDLPESTSRRSACADAGGHRRRTERPSGRRVPQPPGESTA